MEESSELITTGTNIQKTVNNIHSQWHLSGGRRLNGKGSEQIRYKSRIEENYMVRQDKIIGTRNSQERKPKWITDIKKGEKHHNTTLHPLDWPQNKKSG